MYEVQTWFFPLGCPNWIGVFSLRCVLKLAIPADIFDPKLSDVSDIVPFLPTEKLIYCERM